MQRTIVERRSVTRPYEYGGYLLPDRGEADYPREEYMKVVGEMVDAEGNVGARVIVSRLCLN